MSCPNCTVKTNLNEYQNVYKQISPNFNPGVRQWYGVKPDKHYVKELNKPFYSYIPENTPAKSKTGIVPKHCIYGVDVPLHNWIPPTELGKVEGFGTTFGFDIIRLLIVVIIIVILWNYLRNIM